KLLRVLQEQEFERLGGNRTQRVDVRVVAATNVDLAKLVAQRAFRSDLYYRLNVFPIQIPALRERTEDVPLLVRYSVQRFRSALRQRQWRIAGPKGAAAILGMKRTTLQARMRKLGIRRPV